MKPAAKGGSEQEDIIAKLEVTSRRAIVYGSLCVVQRLRIGLTKIRFLVEQTAMKKLLAVVVFCLPAFGQTAYSGRGLYSGSAVYGLSSGAPAFYATLPQLWVDNNELTCPITSLCYTGSPGLSLTAPTYELVLGSSSWSSGPPPSYCTFSLPYAATASGEQSAITDIEACRTSGITHGTAIGIILDVPAGVYTSTNGIVIPQTSGTLANAPLIIRSTYDSTLAAMPEPVCAGGIQDNLATSVNPGLNNPYCTGTNMYYENGPQNASGSSRDSPR